jgi:hypothetical protein
MQLSVNGKPPEVRVRCSRQRLCPPQHAFVHEESVQCSHGINSRRPIWSRRASTHEEEMSGLGAPIAALSEVADGGPIKLAAAFYSVRQRTVINSKSK